MLHNDKDLDIYFLKQIVTEVRTFPDSVHPIFVMSWNALKQLITQRYLQKGEFFIREGECAAHHRSIANDVDGKNACPTNEVTRGNEETGNVLLLHSFSKVQIKTDWKSGVALNLQKI